MLVQAFMMGMVKIMDPLQHIDQLSSPMGSQLRARDLRTMDGDKRHEIKTTRQVYDPLANFVFLRPAKILSRAGKRQG